MMADNGYLAGQQGALEYDLGVPVIRHAVRA